MFCSLCGKAVDDDARFCSQCGMPIREAFENVAALTASDARFSNDDRVDKKG